MQCEGFDKDSAGSLDSDDCAAGSNLGLFYRHQLTKNGNFVELFGTLSLDLMHEEQKTYLINGVPLKIKLWQNKTELCLMTGEDAAEYKLDIAKLKLKHIKLTPEAFIGHQEALLQSDTLYPYLRSDIKTFNIPAGQYSFCADDVYLGCAPSQIIATLVSAQGFNGNYRKNPFNFQSFNCNYIGFFLNGQSVPASPFIPDYSTDSNFESYHSIFNEINFPDISRKE